MRSAGARVHALLGLPPGGGLLDSCRIAFLVLNVANAMAALAAMAFATPDGAALAGSALAICALIAAHWWTARTGRPGVADEAAVAVSMLGASLALPDVTMTMSLMFSAVMFRSLYGSHRAAGLRTLGYVASYAAALYLATLNDRLDAGFSAALLLPLPALVMSALTMRILFAAVRARDAVAARQEILAATATRLLGTTDVAALADAAWSAQARLLGGDQATALMLEKQGDDIAVVVDTSSGATDGAVDPADVAPALDSVRREPVLVRRPGPTLARLEPQARWWYLIPTAEDEHIVRILVLASRVRLPQDVVTSSQVLMRQTALAFDALVNRNELQRQAWHDGLTGLPNRMLFMRLLTEASRQADDRMTAVLFVDLDGFKAVNDRYGHAGGDEVLLTMAERLQVTVGPAGTAARLGGDEFAVLMPAIAVADDAHVLALELAAELRQPLRLSGGATVSVGVSIGVHATRRPCDPDQLLDAADTAMYSVKHREPAQRATR